jgi:hypothetical protein
VTLIAAVARVMAYADASIRYRDDSETPRSVPKGHRELLSSLKESLLCEGHLPHASRN